MASEQERTMVRPAATVVVVRPAEEGVEVLLLRRGSTSPFAPGFIVFPGGSVNRGDRDLAIRLFGDPSEKARACAVRELYEEVGLLVTAAGLEVRRPPRPPLRQVSFAPPAREVFAEIARWVAPDDVPVQFDALFYALAAPSGVDPAPDGVEADRAWWAHPQDVLEERDRGDVRLMWPTIATLEALAGCATVEEVLRLRIEQTPRPESVPPRPPPGADARPDVVTRVLRGTTRIVRVLAPNPGPFTLEGTNTWIVGESPSLVIDPGPHFAGHLGAVLREAVPVSAILLTHQHPDHAPGAGSLARAADAPVYAFRPQGDERPLRHGGVIETETARLRAIHTPGHTPDHVAFLLEREGALFTGDAVLGRGTSVVDPPEGDMAAYLRSLRAMRNFEPKLIYPGHGPVVLDALATLDEYLAHRARREEQILAALTEGPRTPEDIVPGIYGEEIPESMFPVAARSVLAHLLKLEREGRVGRVGPPSRVRFEMVEPRACRRCGRPAGPRSLYCRQCAVAVLQERPERWG